MRNYANMTAYIHSNAKLRSHHIDMKRIVEACNSANRDENGQRLFLCVTPFCQNDPNAGECSPSASTLV